MQVEAFSDFQSAIKVKRTSLSANTSWFNMALTSSQQKHNEEEKVLVVEIKEELEEMHKTLEGEMPMKNLLLKWDI